MGNDAASSASSALLFELCDDALDSDDDVAAHEAALKQRDAATRSERTWAVEKQIVYGADGLGMPAHNSADRALADTQGQWLPALLDEEAIRGRGLEIERVAYAERSVAEFEARHVNGPANGGLGLPFIAVGAAAEEGWPALEKWRDRESFLAAYADVPLHITEVFPMGEFGKPHAVRLPAGLYLEYSEANRADFPYYPFERDFDSPAAEDEGRAALLRDFAPPKYFRSDVYALSDATRRCFLKHKFVLVGGQRTGANMHQDPMGTAAWNTLIAGRKRWVFFPPDADPAAVLTGELGSRPARRGEGRGAEAGGYGSVVSMSKTTGASPVLWWLDVYPKLVAAPPGGGPSLAERLGMVEVLQRADETIYTPPYWFHAVLNVTDFTIAATGNVLSPAMLVRQWPHYRAQYPEDAKVLREALLEQKLATPEQLPLEG